MAALLNALDTVYGRKGREQGSGNREQRSGFRDQGSGIRESENQKNTGSIG